MLHNIIYNMTCEGGVNSKSGVDAMARGKSGRIVLVVGVNLKNAIHDRLSAEGVTLKDWFIEKAVEYLQSPPKSPLSSRFTAPKEVNSGEGFSCAYSGKKGNEGPRLSHMQRTNNCLL